MNTLHVQVILDSEPLPPTLAAALDRARVDVTVNHFDDVSQTGRGREPDAVVVVVRRDQQAARPRIEQILSSFAKQPCGTLVLTEDPLNGLGSAARPPGLPISFAVNPSVDELTARLVTICEYGEPLRHIARQTERLMQHSRQMVQEVDALDEQLRLAGQVQRDFLPQRVPQCEGARFVTLFRPADYVSGDIYDLTRLDETHIGISVADVTGHGVPAALLTLFIKRAWRAKVIDGNSYRIIPPNELLAGLNRDVLEVNLEQCQFVTACCAVYDQHQRLVTWARGGLPYPILVRPGEGARQIRTAGELIGAFEDARFELRSEQLRPGDAMIFFSDGLEALLLGGPVGRCDLLDQTEWFARLGQGTIEDHIDEIRHRLDEIQDEHWPRDDVTIVAICVDP